MISDLTNYGKHFIDQEDIDAVLDVLRDGLLTCGPMVPRFEKSLADFVGAKHALACSNGTAALHMATKLSISSGQAAIVPSITFLATANAVCYNGGEVIFADVDPNTGLMSPQHFEQALVEAKEHDVTTVIPVHLAGQCENMEEIAAIARHHSITVIEDACHALGSKYISASGDSYPIGNCHLSDMSVFSFHPVKNIATGEGGVITCNNDKFTEKLQKMRSHGMLRDTEDFIDLDAALDSKGSPNPWYYEMQELGFNYRLTDIQAALGLAQLEKLTRFTKKRQELRDYYNQLIKSYAPLLKPTQSLSCSEPAWHIYTVLIEFDELNRERSEVMHSLKKRGIGSQVHYIPVYRQPFYVKRNGNISLEGAENYYQRTLTLPLFYSMSFKDVDYVVEQLINLLGIK